MSMCAEFDLRFVVIHDRWDNTKYGNVSIEVCFFFGKEKRKRNFKVKGRGTTRKLKRKRTKK